MTEAGRQKRVPAWALWANPILIRYARSRLRAKQLFPWGLVVLIITCFIFFLIHTIAQRSGQLSYQDAARITLIPLMILQGILLMLMGTGAVAAGIVQESTEGIIDYQRLTPLSPLTKILGYLFGLPIREYALVSLTVPFTIHAIVVGEIRWESVMWFYLVFIASAILYHLTGLVAGTVVKKKFLAGRTSQMLVVILYFILPRFATLGFVFFIYLTVLPAWKEQAVPYLSSSVPIDRLLPGMGESVPWFRWSFTPTIFSLIIQCGFILVFMVVLARKWRDPDCHILGNAFSIAVFTTIMALLLGNAVPLIQDGHFFDYASSRPGRSPIRGFSEQYFAWLTTGLMGLAIFLTALLFIRLITPTKHEAIRGYRRAKKLGRTRVAPFSDDVTSLYYTLGLVLLGWLSWNFFSHTMFQSHVLEDAKVPKLWWLYNAPAFMLPLIAFHAVLEHSGGRTVLVWLLLVWIVPPLAAIILAAGRFEDGALFLAAVSGPLLPLYAVGNYGVEVYGTRPSNTASLVPAAFRWALLFYAVLTPILVVRLFRYRRHLMTETAFR